jgi:hypothetical protein
MQYMIAIIFFLGLAMILGPVGKLWFCCAECIMFVFMIIGMAQNNGPSV